MEGVIDYEELFYQESRILRLSMVLAIVGSRVGTNRYMVLHCELEERVCRRQSDDVQVGQDVRSVS